MTVNEYPGDLYMNPHPRCEGCKFLPQARNGGYCPCDFGNACPEGYPLKED